MDKISIGIDPGLDGALSKIDGNEITVMKMPLIAKEEIDVEAVLAFIDCGGKPCHIGIEAVHSIFGASANSNWTFGFGCGMLYATLKLSGLPFTKVPPKTWQKEMWQGVNPITITKKKEKKDKKTGVVEIINKESIDTKATSLLACKRLFPKVNLLATPKSKVDHNGIVDALLLADFIRRKNY